MQLLLVVLTLKQEIISQTNEEYEKYSGTSWNFLKLNTFAGLVAMLGHGGVITSSHLYLPMTSPCNSAVVD